MTKNMTRKGLALGAAFALVGSALVASPAQAAGELNLQPKTGTTYGSIIGETFTLSVNANPGYASTEFAGTKLKFNVTNPSKGALTITAGGAANAGSVNAGAADNSNYVVTHQAPSTSAANDIAISTAATATSSVTVQAWIDSDFDSVIDSNEWTSASQTIVFNKASEVTWTTEFTTPAIGDTKFTAYVSAAPSINMAQIADANLGVRFGKAATDAGEQFTGKAAATFDATTGKLKFNPTIALVVDSAVATPAAIANNAAAVAGGFRYDAQAAWKATGLGDLATLVAEANLVGSQVAYAVGAATITTIAVPATDKSDNASQTGAAVTVRDSATTVPVSILVSDANGGVKNTKVTVYVGEAAVGGTDTNATTAVGNYDSSTFTAGGKTLQDTSATAQVISFEATTNADGKVVFDLTASAKAGDAVIVWASAQNVNVNGAAAGAVSTAANKATYTWTAATVASVKNTDVKGTGAVLKQAAGSTFSLNYTVLDQWGAAIPTADKYRVVISDGTDSWYPVVSAGKVSQSITLASTATGTKSYSSEVQVKGTDGNYANLGARIQGTAVSVVVGTSNAATSFTALSDITTAGTVNAALSTTAANTIALSTRTSVLDTVAFVAGDKNAGATNTVKGTLTTGFVVKGAVTDSTTAGTYSTVTLSGTNLNFVVTDTLYAAGSVTVQTDANGAYEGIRVLSNKSGKQTLTITAGSVSKSYVVDFGDADATAGTSLVITAPESVEPGSTLTVVAKLTDKFGNPVKTTAADRIAVSYTGPGLQVGSYPTGWDANGEAKLGYFLGANDSGTITVVFSYNQDGTDDVFTTAGKDLVVTKTIAIGTSEANQGALATWTKNLGDGSVKMYAKNVIGQGKVQFMLNGKEVAWTRANTATDVDGASLRTVGAANYLVRTVDLAKGKNVLEIYVDGYRMKRVVYSY